MFTVLPVIMGTGFCLIDSNREMLAFYCTGDSHMLPVADTLAGAQRLQDIMLPRERPCGAQNRAVQMASNTREIPRKTRIPNGSHWMQSVTHCCMAFAQVKIPLECPFHPMRDIFAPQQAAKVQNRPSQWTCGFCGKSFYEEQHLDHHFEQRHGGNINMVCACGFILYYSFAQ